jgi:ABC-type uncharacterized transport system permease subunit
MATMTAARLSPAPGLYSAVAARSFRRYSTYRGATLAGIFTNSVFGLILCYVYTAVWEADPDAGGYDLTDALTFVWLGQAQIMTVAMWGGGATDDLAARIKSGDVAIDFYRPVGLLGWYLAADLGRAAYHLLWTERKRARASESEVVGRGSWVDLDSGSTRSVELLGLRRR